MSALLTFDFEENIIRTTTINGEPWFVGKDICKCLDISNHNDAIQSLDDDEKGVAITDPLASYSVGGGAQQTTVISEAGVYRLVFRSRKPEAERFKRFLAHEVLPAIRKTGIYAPNMPDIDAMAEKLRLVQEARRLYGRKAAQKLWQTLGLPPVLDEQETKRQADDKSLVDYLRDYIDECFIEDATSRITFDEAYKLYNAWATKNKAPYFTKNHFGKLMINSLYIRQRKTSGNSCYLGWRLSVEKRQHYGLVVGAFE